VVSEKFDYLKPTGVFIKVGLFIPGFTAIVLLGIQMLLVSFGVECSHAWSFIWVFTTIGAIVFPIIFFKSTRKADSSRIKSWLTVFNIIEYICIQGCLAQFMTDGNTLCYVGDGQNGIELVFTAWLALPIIYLISLTFNKVDIK
jgi:hypothetical protein